MAKAWGADHTFAGLGDFVDSDHEDSEKLGFEIICNAMQNLGHVLQSSVKAGKAWNIAESGISSGVMIGIRYPFSNGQRICTAPRTTSKNDNRKTSTSEAKLKSVAARTHVGIASSSAD